MSNKLEEAALKLASSGRKQNKQADQFLDRTIYYAKERTDADGKVVVDANGEPIVEMLVYRLAGSWVTESMMDRCLELEKEFSKLNKLLRDDMEAQGLPWRIRKAEITAMQVSGLI